ncbi:MAG TPA: DUF1192 domain-containing protein [Magnetospirillum sp.]|nr:DUF1192 domain-containing protein [Magnetospirillum sp.]
MDWDDIEPKKKSAALRNLEIMGVAELNAYITELEAEIARVRAAIAAKQSARQGAEGFFKK